MMPRNISDRHRCIFLHIPKVAGTSIKRALDLPGGGHRTWSHVARHFPCRWRRYRKFTVVRNPWDRLVSAYAYAQMELSHWHGAGKPVHPDHNLLTGVSFAACVRLLLRKPSQLSHESWAPQHVWVAAREHGRLVPKVDRILRYEHLQSDFARLCSAWEIECSHLPHLNGSEHSSYRDYYDDETRAAVEQYYEVDIRLFGYSF